MSNRRRITDQSEAETAEAIDVEFDDRSQLEADERAEEAEILEHFGEADDATEMNFQVRRIKPNSRKTIYCFDGTAADLPVIPRIQREFGAGVYKIWIFKNRKLFRNIQIEVAEARAVQQPSAPISANDATMQKLLELLERQSQQREMSKPLSVTEIITASATIVTALQPVLALLKNNNAPPSISEQLEALQRLKELTEPAPPQDDSLLGLAKLFLPAISRAVEEQPEKRPALAAPTNKQLSPEQVQHAQMAQLQQQLRYMITRAQKNSPPELYADFIEDNLPEPLVQQLMQPGAFEFLSAIEPTIQTYKPWFEAVLQSLANGAIDDDVAGRETMEQSSVPQGHTAPNTGFNPEWSSRGADYVEGDGDNGEGG